MNKQRPPKNKIGAFIVGTCFGAFLSIIPLITLPLKSATSAAIAVACIAIPFGLIAAFACPKKMEKVVAYFLTFTNP